ncbi:hypothetical protein ABB37_02977 [Leptomonas pyrrhocoris]|uniref:Uncharacterized protein n=1 Tax=Leptomonas pyrrhocoris TaxID=157538 RepID=A0A0M9G6K0_LEPPY|nr:hypothetical protein ABB37_02977 [Leptomonas pyrrhocoris]KPA83316.1 hypothetical protein ABB37_02977 [Leptomonas pyrrhocoris]|eukprot:XP_015661755.1 hypothetical protein ABB37_02977 [Leptomonas pyrrhocoris]
MAYIAFPSATGGKPSPPGNSSGAQGDAFGEYSAYRRVIRTIVCGLFFAVPLCVSIPLSPLLKLSLTQENKKSIVPRMISDFFYVNFAASAAAYWLLVEPFIPNPKAREGFLPYLGPLTAQVPAMSCLFTSHLFYPGLWAIYNEPTWALRRREFVRLNVKCFFAFGPIHIPSAVGLGVSIGLLLYPFKFMKLRCQRSAEKEQLKR